MNKYEQAVFVLQKIANWNPEERHMSYEDAFKCCQGMAKVFMQMNDTNVSTKKEGNVIFSDVFSKRNQA